MVLKERKASDALHKIRRQYRTHAVNGCALDALCGRSDSGEERLYPQFAHPYFHRSLLSKVSGTCERVSFT